MAHRIALTLWRLDRIIAWEAREIGDAILPNNKGKRLRRSVPGGRPEPG